MTYPTIYSLPRNFLRLISLVAALAVAGDVAVAQEPTRIRFSLDWKIQGIHAWYYWALKKGYFAAENLAVTIDQGEGSAATVTRILSGAYDAGFGDINALVQVAATRPAESPVMVYTIYSKAPFALLVRASSPIHALSDLAGRKVGSPAGSAALKLLPALAARSGLDMSKVEIVNMAPNLQEQMLVQGQVDAAAVFTATSYVNLVALKLDPERDFRWIHYSESGMDLYSNGIIVSQKLLQERPEAVRGLVRAINRSIRETVSDPEAAIDLLATQEPLISRSIERQRLAYVYKTLVDTPEAKERGIGDVRDSKLSVAIDIVAASYGLSSRPASASIFSRLFLPPLDERLPMPIR